MGTASSFGLPEWPILALLGIDELMDMARTSVNVDRQLPGHRRHRALGGRVPARRGLRRLRPAVPRATARRPPAPSAMKIAAWTAMRAWTGVGENADVEEDAADQQDARRRPRA